MSSDGPIPPESLPEPLSESLRRQDVTTLRDAQDYIQELIDWQSATGEQSDNPDGDLSWMID